MPPLPVVQQRFAEGLTIRVDMASPAPPITAQFALGCHYELTVYCGPCRDGRLVDIAALAVAQGDKPLRKMTFRCTTCGSTDATVIVSPGPGRGYGRVDWWKQEG